MYLHLGNSRIVRSDTVIGFFDLDNTSRSDATRDFLAAAESEGRLALCDDGLPRCFVVCDDGVVYLTRISAKTLAERLKRRG